MSNSVVGAVYQNKFFSRRAHFPADLPDGWYILKDALRRRLEPAVFLPKADLDFYLVGNSFIPTNFGDYRFKIGESYQKGSVSDFELKLFPESLPDFSVIKVKIIRGHLFYVRSFSIDMDLLLAASGSEVCNKGWTPEKKMALAVSLLKIEKAKELLFEELIQDRSEMLDVEIISKEYLPSGNVEIEWSVYGRRFRTEIVPETLAVIRAGFCLSGDDRKFTFTNLPTLAKEAIRTGDLYVG